MQGGVYSAVQDVAVFIICADGDDVGDGDTLCSQTAVAPVGCQVGAQSHCYCINLFLHFIFTFFIQRFIVFVVFFLECTRTVLYRFIYLS